MAGDPQLVVEVEDGVDEFAADALVESALTLQQLTPVLSGSAWKYAVYSGEVSSSVSSVYSIGKNRGLRVSQVSE